MFFLPLPLDKTLETLSEIGQPNESNDVSAESDGGSKHHLAHPELYIMINGKTSKQKHVWRSIVDVEALKAVVRN